MANVFVVTWTYKNRSVRDKVEFGNFDGNVEEAQRQIDQLWPYAYPHRKNVRVESMIGSGEVAKVTIPPPDATAAKVATK